MRARHRERSQSTDGIGNLSDDSMCHIYVNYVCMYVCFEQTLFFFFFFFWMPIRSHINCKSSQFYSHLKSNRAKFLANIQEYNGRNSPSNQSCEGNLQLKAAVQNRELFLLWVFLRREVKRKRGFVSLQKECLQSTIAISTQFDKWEKIPNCYWVLLF